MIYVLNIVPFFFSLFFLSLQHNQSFESKGIVLFNNAHNTHNTLQLWLLSVTLNSSGRFRFGVKKSTTAILWANLFK